MPSSPLAERVALCFESAANALLEQRRISGTWEGELSASALSTATAVMALEMVRRQAAPDADVETFARPIAAGLQWIAAHQLADGGWGDTLKSHSNISTTMLCHAVFHATGTVAEFATVVAGANAWIARAGGVAALRERYGKDQTFSIPILTHCALAGLVNWKAVAPLPFELACIPARFYRLVRFPVVSYALPALIAIGQARHHFVKPRNPVTRLLRNAAVQPSLRILTRIQPSSGGFLEAAPLTSFVTMSLAGMGMAHHPVARLGIEFLLRSVREDGSWPIDSNLATWVTTLTINALERRLPPETVPALRAWLLGQQHRELHPYTNAAPGGWAWTDLPGGVPDADDTPGALLALLNLQDVEGASLQPETRESLAAGVRWLLDLQNRDGGWPTFCRGWGVLPFDRSAPDLTAHALRALSRWRIIASPPNAAAIERASFAGFRYLEEHQRDDGSWLPLWFGNQDAPDDENPTYGTARVLAAYVDTGRLGSAAAQRGLDWLRDVQNADGSWGGAAEIAGSIEETALALEMLLAAETPGTSISSCSLRGLGWLLHQVETGNFSVPSPIGFYFAKLWYFEKLYPLIFTTAALNRARDLFVRPLANNSTGPTAVP